MLRRRVRSYPASMRNTWVVTAIGLCLLVGCGSDADGGGSGGAGSSGASGSGGTAGSAATGGSSGSGATGGTGGTSGSSGGESGSSGGGGESGNSGSGGTAGSEGPWAIPDLPYSVTPTTAIDAPADQWTYVAFPDSKCANGTATGIAINPIDDAIGLLVFMQGGGACWDADTCLVRKASVHLEDTVGEATVLAEAGGLSGLFDHGNQANPFRQFAYVYMPYCTGDLHAGQGTQTYNAGAGDVTIEHHGGRNVEAYLKRLRATFPNIGRVVVSGISAGGFGATLNWWRYQGAFPYARVDIWDDAGLLVDATDARWSVMVNAWDMVLPPGCDACDERMSAWLPFYGAHLLAPRRYALSGYLGDAVIGQYFGLTAEMIESQMLALRAATAANQKTFFLSGTQHSVIGEGALTMTSDNTSLLPWILQYALDDAAWDHAGP